MYSMAFRCLLIVTSMVECKVHNQPHSKSEDIASPIDMTMDLLIDTSLNEMDMGSFNDIVEIPPTEKFDTYGDTLYAESLLSTDTMIIEKKNNIGSLNENHPKDLTNLLEKETDKDIEMYIETTSINNYSPVMESELVKEEESIPAKKSNPKHLPTMNLYSSDPNLKFVEDLQASNIAVEFLDGVKDAVQNPMQEMQGQNDVQEPISPVFKLLATVQVPKMNLKASDVDLENIPNIQDKFLNLQGAVKKILVDMVMPDMSQVSARKQNLAKVMEGLASEVEMGAIQEVVKEMKIPDSSKEVLTKSVLPTALVSALARMKVPDTVVESLFNMVVLDDITEYTRKVVEPDALEAVLSKMAKPDIDTALNNMVMSNVVQDVFDGVKDAVTALGRMDGLNIQEVHSRMQESDFFKEALMNVSKKLAVIEISNRLQGSVSGHISVKGTIANIFNDIMIKIQELLASPVATTEKTDPTAQEVIEDGNTTLATQTMKGIQISTAAEEAIMEILSASDVDLDVSQDAISISQETPTVIKDDSTTEEASNWESIVNNQDADVAKGSEIKNLLLLYKIQQLIGYTATTDPTDLKDMDESQASLPSQGTREMQPGSMVQEAMLEVGVTSGVQETLTQVQNDATVQDNIKELRAAIYVQEKVAEVPIAAIIDEAISQMHAASTVQAAMPELRGESLVQEALLDEQDATAFQEAMAAVHTESAVQESMAELQAAAAFQESIAEVRAVNAFQESMAELQADAIQETMADLMAANDVQEVMARLLAEIAVQETMADKEVFESSVQQIMEKLQAAATVQEAMALVQDISSVQETMLDVPAAPVKNSMTEAQTVAAQEAFMAMKISPTNDNEEFIFHHENQRTKNLHESKKQEKDIFFTEEEDEVFEPITGKDSLAKNHNFHRDKSDDSKRLASVKINGLISNEQTEPLPISMDILLLKEVVAAEAMENLEDVIFPNLDHSIVNFDRTEGLMIYKDSNTDIKHSTDFEIPPAMVPEILAMHSMNHEMSQPGHMQPEMSVGIESIEIPSNLHRYKRDEPLGPQMPATMAPMHPPTSMGDTMPVSMKPLSLQMPVSMGPLQPHTSIELDMPIGMMPIEPEILPNFHRYKRDESLDPEIPASMGSMKQSSMGPMDQRMPVSMEPLGPEMPTSMGSMKQSSMGPINQGMTVDMEPFGPEMEGNMGIMQPLSNMGPKMQLGMKPVEPEMPTFIGPMQPSASMGSMQSEITAGMLPMDPEMSESMETVMLEMPTSIEPMVSEITESVQMMNSEMFDSNKPLEPGMPSNIKPFGPERPANTDSEMSVDMDSLRPEMLPMDALGPEMPVGMGSIQPEMPNNMKPLGTEMPNKIIPMDLEMPAGMEPMQSEMPASMEPVVPDMHVIMQPMDPEMHVMGSTRPEMTNGMGAMESKMPVSMEPLGPEIPASMGSMKQSSMGPMDQGMTVGIVPFGTEMEASMGTMKPLSSMETEMQLSMKPVDPEMPAFIGPMQPPASMGSMQSETPDMLPNGPSNACKRADDES
ncbi:unnamed protein product [Meganyctiphanes norvegica]|uniref:Uncharacterized protein n=1 Tax=Meganyctiphanes norvegica TaxID=48144 RepID=A0AAV2PXK9_MEGNR